MIPLVSCTNNTSDDEKKTLTIYSGRSEKLVGPIIEQFSEATGIDTRVKYGGTSELAATILEEGDKSPADIFFAQDPAGLGALEDKFTTLPDEVLVEVNDKFKSDDKKWVGTSGRARTVVYNTNMLTEQDLPDDMFGFTDPKWKGKIGWAPTNGSFQAMVTGMRKIWGDEKTKEWLNGINANNPKSFPNNTSTVAAVANGEVEVGFVNHYYLYRFLEEQGMDFSARNYHIEEGGPGALILVAGAGVLETSENKEEAIEFLEFMLSPVSQQFFASQNYEYPVVEGVKINPMLKPLADINSPKIEMSDMNDLQGTVTILRGVEIIP
ncbi:MAG: iron ABC transporter substrate-binding protein [Thermodesulfobacteriota bacterium]